MICLTPKQSQSVFVHRIQRKKITKTFLRKSRERRIEQKQKRRLFNCSFAVTIQKNLMTSIRKHSSELKVHEKTVWSEINEDLSSYFNPLDYAIWGILEGKQQQFPIQIFVRLSLLLRRNGIEYLQNLY